MAAISNNLILNNDPVEMSPVFNTKNLPMALVKTSEKPEIAGHKVIGLSKVTKRGRLHHYFWYRAEGVDMQCIYEHKLKGVKDLRSYEEAHPVKDWIQQFALRWNPVGQLIFSGIGSAAAAKVRITK